MHQLHMPFQTPIVPPVWMICVLTIHHPWTGFVTAFVRNKLWNYGYHAAALHGTDNSECGSR